MARRVSPASLDGVPSASHSQVHVRLGVVFEGEWTSCNILPRKGLKLTPYQGTTLIVAPRFVLANLEETALSLTIRRGL